MRQCRKKLLLSKNQQVLIILEFKVCNLNKVLKSDKDIAVRTFIYTLQNFFVLSLKCDVIIEFTIC